MISNRIRKAIQISVFAAGAALAGGTAQAAAYTGTWDPAYGSAFPQLGWKGSAKFVIPDACLLQSGWINNNATCSNDGMKITTGHVDLYTLNPEDASDTSKIFASWDFDATSSVVTKMEVTGKTLTGINGGFMVPWNPWNQSNQSNKVPSALKDTYFWLGFAPGPEMLHVTCNETVTLKQDISKVLPFPSVQSDVTGWLNSNYTGQCGSKYSSWGWNDNGDAPGASLKFTSLVLTNPPIGIPEPASLALVLSALGAGWAARRRRSS